MLRRTKDLLKKYEDTLFKTYGTYIYIQNITSQVKQGMTKTQYFDFTLKSGSKENS